MAVHYGLLNLKELLDLMTTKPDRVELIITGRYAHKKVIQKADLVTEMKEIKHYRNQGIRARIGIEK